MFPAMESDQTVILKRTTADVKSGEAMCGPAQPVEIPRQLGSVRLLRQIGQGGMGVVWLGRHELLNREVAVKFLLNLVADEDDPGFAALLEGARAAAALRHEGLNAVLHADVVDRVPFLVMEYVEGPTVSQVLQRFGKLSPCVVRLLLEATCAAVGELHDQNVIHRDIKPSNILLSQDGKPVLTDFGLACWRSSTSLGTTVKGVAGTPAYMAPEMFEKTVSPRSDVYAIGAMAFEMLIGEVPFEGSLEAIEKAHREQALPPEALASLNSELAQLIERSMHKNPMFRYKSARHMLRAVEEVFAGMDQAHVGSSRGKPELASIISRAFKGCDDGSLAGSAADMRGTYYDRLGTLVNSRKKPTTNPGASDDELLQRISQDTPCVRCGSNLKGEPVTGRCPNCLLLVKLTLNPEAGAASGGTWKRTQSRPEAACEPETATAPAAGVEPSVHALQSRLVPTQPPAPAPLAGGPKAESWKGSIKRLWNDLLGR